MSKPITDTTAINRITAILNQLTPAAAGRVMHFIHDAHNERLADAFRIGYKQPCPPPNFDSISGQASEPGPRLS